MIFRKVIHQQTNTLSKSPLIDSNISLFDRDGNSITIGDITSVSNIVIPVDAEIEFQLDVIEGALFFVVKIEMEILRVPVPSYSEITVSNGQINLWGSDFNKSFTLNEDVLITTEETAIIRISETWEREDLGIYPMAKLAGANCARFTSPVSLGLTLAELGISHDKDWTIAFYLKDNRTYLALNMLINAGPFFIYSNPHLDGGQLIVGTSESSTGTFFCQTPKFVEGLFVLVYYSNEKRMKIYYNGVLCFDEVKTFNPWDTSQEVFLAKTRFLVCWQTESDFNMAGLGFYDRTLSETEIIEYCKNALPENPLLYLPLSEGDNNVVHSLGFKEKYHLSNSNCATFDGINAYVQLPKYYCPNKDFSISMWVKRGRNNTEEVLASHTRSESNGGTFFAISFESDNTIKFSGYGGGGASDYPVTTETYTTTDGWIYLEFGHSSSLGTSGKNFIRVNGGDYVLSTNDVTTLLPQTIDNSYPTIGIYDYNKTSPFQGSMVDYKVTNDLTGEVILHIPFSEGVGTIAYDVSGNGNHGTITNATSSTFWGTKQDNFHYNLTKGHSKALYFNGSDTFVEVTSNDFDIEDVSTKPFEVSFGAHFLGTQTVLFVLGNTDYNSFRVGLTTGNVIRIVGSTNGSSWGILETSSGAISEGYHDILLTRDVFGNCSLTVDGVEEISFTNASDIVIDTNKLRIGAHHSENYNLKGWITNFDFKVNGTSVAKYSGYGETTWIDLSGNSNDGSVQGTASTIRVPALTDGSADAAGGTLLNPAWNGVESNESETSIAKNIELETGTVSASVGWDSQDMLHYNLFNGFTLAGDFKIPAIPGSKTDYDGNALTNLPWDGMNLNGSESYWKNL